MLRESRYGEPEDIEVMTSYFDKTTKPTFKSSSKPYFIRFGRSESDPQFNIRNGSVKLDGSVSSSSERTIGHNTPPYRSEIAEFFEPAVQSVVRIIEEQSGTSSIPIKVYYMCHSFRRTNRGY